MVSRVGTPVSRRGTALTFLCFTCATPREMIGLARAAQLAMAEPEKRYLFLVVELCSRVIVLDQGRIQADGPANEIMDRYAGAAE